MKKSKKLLRKLLKKWQDELVNKPYTKEISTIVDCADYLIGRLGHENNS